jgi:predicted ATP-binding protein involved in virulence
MRIKEIKVHGLYNMFDYDIPMKTNSQMTIIHAPNGYGKTTLLKLITAILVGDDPYIRQIPFKKMEFKLDDGSSLIVDKGGDGKGLTYICKRRRGRKATFKPSKVDERIKGAKPPSATNWRDPATGKPMDFEDVMGIFKWLAPQEVPSWLLDIRRSIPVRFIGSDRLISSGNTPAVNVFAEELKDTIESKLAESVALSQELDRTFPSRLIDELKSDKRKVSQEDIQDQLKELEERRKRLRRVGLLDPGDPVQPKGKMDRQTLRVLSLYIKDVKQKLTVFDELEQKINLLKRVIRKLFRHKRIWISKEDGITFKLPNGDVLRPEELASGEQHELVLHYELLFKCEPESLVLIDEPEISLHIIWQEELLGDLEEIANMNGLEILMATHSPQVISDRWDLAVDLAGGDAEE